MTCATRYGIVVCLTGLALCWAGGVRAQPKSLPSTLLPLETLWTIGLPAVPAVAPVHEAGRVYVAMRDGHVAAVNLADGDVVWQVMHGAVGQVVVGGDLLYVATDEALHGLDAATGSTRWSMSLEAKLSAPLVWNAGWLIAALDTHDLLALRAETGETIWRQVMADRIRVPPALAGNRMFLSLDDGSVVALSLGTGEASWQRRLEGRPTEILPLDALFVGATDNHFYRLSTLDGSIEWRWPTGGDIVGVAAVDEKRVYFTSLDNMLWALNRTSGVQQWRQPLADRPTSGPRYAGNLLMLGGLSQELRFFDPIDGVPYGELSGPTELAFPPISISASVDGPLLITVTGDGRLRVLRRATGPDQRGAAHIAALFQEPDETIPADEDAEEIDTVAGGTAGVATTAVAPVDPAVEPLDGTAVEAPARVLSVGGEYAVQVAALANSAAARALAERLANLGHPTYVLEPNPGDEPGLYRVRIGDYPDRASAEALGRTVEAAEDLDWFVVELP